MLTAARRRGSPRSSISSAPTDTDIPADQESYSNAGIGLSGFEPITRCGDTVWSSTLSLHERKVDRMRSKLTGLKHLLFTAATLATLALAAGARYKPK